MSKNIFFLTNEGLNKIKKEKDVLERKKDYMLKFEFPVFNRSKRTDPDYVNCLEEINFIKKRILEINDILRNAKIITETKKPAEIVDLGAKVTVQDEKGAESMSFQIVDTIETNPSKGKISRISPLGAALLGKKLKEIVFVSSPVNKKYVIKDIKYA